MLGQDVELAEDGRQFAVARLLEEEGDAVRRFNAHLSHIGPVLPVVRPALGDQRVEGPEHILGGHRGAVMEARLGPQFEADRPAIGRGFDGVGDVAIGDLGLVGIGAQQGVVDLQRGTSGAAAHDMRAEAVEGADSADRHLAALGGRRVGIQKMREAERQLGRAEQRHGVAAGGCGGLRLCRGGQQAGQDRQHRGGQSHDHCSPRRPAPRAGASRRSAL